MNENPVVTSAVVGVITLAALAFLVKQACGSRGTGTGGDEKAFFTFDEGKTWFVDDAKHLPPYQKDGKTALRARVFKCGGKEMVLLLEQYPPDVKARIEGGETGMVIAQGLEVRKVTDKKWASMMKNLQDYSKITTAKCPDGSVPEPVLPPSE